MQASVRGDSSRPILQLPLHGLQSPDGDVAMEASSSHIPHIT